jgi:hypothetical protein
MGNAGLLIIYWYKPSVLTSYSFFYNLFRSIILQALVFIKDENKSFVNHASNGHEIAHESKYVVDIVHLYFVSGKEANNPYPLYR